MSTQQVFPKTSYRATQLPCGLDVVKTWVAIQLTDEKNKPVPKAKYVIIFPDGTQKEDELDDNGYAYFGDLDPGLCQVAFPELSPYCELVTSVSQSKRTDDSLGGNVGAGGVALPPKLESIDIQLLDESGKKGVPNERYQITTPDGDVAQGFLDGDGKAHLDGISTAGNCLIRFPDMDGSFVSFVESK